MKIGQQSTTDATYACAVLKMDSACSVCPPEHMGMYLLEDRVVPKDSEFSEWPECQGSSSSEPPWYLDVFPLPAEDNKLCVLNRADAQNQFYECITYAEYQTQPPSSLKTGMSAFYKFDDLSDSSGNGNSLANPAGVTFEVGKVGNAAVFNGSGQFLTSSAPQPSSSITLAAWVYLNPDVWEAFIVDSVTGNNWEGGGSGLVAINGGFIRFYLFYGGCDPNPENCTEPLDSTDPVPTGEWHHVAGTFDSSTNVMSLYIDGQLNNTKTVQNRTTPFGGTLANNFGIGSNADGTYGLMSGKIDALGIWSRALAISEISSLCNGGLGTEDLGAYQFMSGPYFAEECESQCPPTQSIPDSPKCIPLSDYDPAVHLVCGGPYYSQDQCGTGCGSSSSSDFHGDPSSSSESNPTCEPTFKIITSPDGTILVVPTCSEGGSSSSSEDADQRSSSSACELGTPPENETVLCSDGTVSHRVFYMPNFRDCVWSPLTYTVNECPPSSSSCEHLDRYCLYSQLNLNNLSVIFAQEDKPPPCTYRHYCLPEGCVYLCEDDSLGTPMESCLSGDCCGEGVCDRDCEAKSYANCIVCAMYGGYWFYQGQGWKSWHDSNCGCCCMSNGSEIECVGNVKEAKCKEGGGLSFSISCTPYDPYGFHGGNHGSNQCSFSWTPGECKSSSSSSSSFISSSSSSSSSVQSNYICDFYTGCVQNYYGDWGTTLAECESTCLRNWTCYTDGCQQLWYYYPTQPGQFTKKEDCESLCLQRYACDSNSGCVNIGFATDGLLNCDSCVVVDKVCDPYDPCRTVWGIGSPSPTPVPCPQGCEKYWDCTSYGCQQSYYYSLSGYNHDACKIACLETFYCDNYARCVGSYSDYYKNPYEDKSSCEFACTNRYYCDMINGCLPSGYGTYGAESCADLLATPECVHRYYCDEFSGCMDMGWGYQQGYDLSCDSSSCVKYFVCVPGIGCVEKYIKSSESIPGDGYATFPECAASCKVAGCTNPNSPNYNQNATCDDGSCLTCCNQKKCVIDDDSPCRGPNCNALGSSQSSCCDYGCLPCGTLTTSDCSPSFQGSFKATACDGSQIDYPSCFDCCPSGKEMCNGDCFDPCPAHMNRGEDCLCSCSVCWTQTFTFQGAYFQPYRECDPQVKETLTFEVPEYIPIPSQALVSYSADDDIAINGVRMRPGDCGAGSGTDIPVQIESRSVTLDLIDTVGINWSGQATFKMCHIKEECGGECLDPCPSGQQRNENCDCI